MYQVTADFFFCVKSEHDFSDRFSINMFVTCQVHKLTKCP